MSRLVSLLVLASLFGVPLVAAAQQTVPPAAPTIGASGGLGAGIAVPVGNLNDTHAAGYVISGLVDFSAADQPYSFRAELIYQHYDRKTAAAPGVRSMNITSLGAALLARNPSAQGSSGFVLGGIGVYRMTDRGTKPGINAGLGLEVPLTLFVGIADVRVHYVLTDGKPTITIPVTLGARF
jgi:hypothetical protein